MLTTARQLVFKLRASVVIGLLVLGLTACGSTKWGFPYRADVQQGNWITADQVARLEPGMTREQVRFVLGSPTLQDVFRTNRWDYPYYNKPGYGAEEERKFTVWFEDDILVRWEGDKQPDRQPFERTDQGTNLSETPYIEPAYGVESQTEINVDGTEVELNAAEFGGPEVYTGEPMPDPQPLR